MNTDQTNDPKNSRPGWRSYSLREVLLAMTAIAALLALYRQSRAPEMTSFARNLDVEALLLDIGERCQLSFQMRRSGNPTIITNRTMSSGARYGFAFLDPIDLQTKVMPALQDEINQLLAKHGCRVTGKIQSGSAGRNLAATDVSGIKYMAKYRKGRTRGAIHVLTSYNRDGEPQLRVLIHEW